MDQLPSDILYKIFIQVPFNQKKICLLVCRLWKDIISSRCLYHTLEISDHGRFFELLDIMDREPSLKTQVINLALIEWDSATKKKAVEYFPNLQDFSFSARSAETFEINELETTTSKSRMRTIRDQGDCHLLVDLSKRGLCDRLSEVSVAYFNPNSVLPVLKNMPALKTLMLERSGITIAQLEVIHADIPTLETLGVHFNTLEEVFPKNVVPASNITALYVEVEYAIEDEQLNWLNYVTEKYPRLESYDFETDTNGYQDYDDEAFDYIYGVLFTPFLKKLGPQLKYLNLAGAQFNNYKVFDKLDEFGCRIKNTMIESNDECTWQSSLSQTNQGNYLEDLAIYDVKSTSFDWLKNMKVLNSLRINFDSDSKLRIDLSAFFKSCSKTVKSINFNYADHCDLNDDTFEISHQIERIELNCRQISVNFDTFISKCLPNLHYFVLNGDLQLDMKMSIPSHHFSFVRLYLFTKGDYNVSVTTLKNSERKLFRPKDKKTYVKISNHDNFIKPISPDGFGDQPFVDLVFASVRKLMLDNHEALLN